MYSTTGTDAKYTAGAEDDFDRIKEANSRCPPLLSSVLDLSQACVIDRRAFVGVRKRRLPLEPDRTSL